MGAKPSKPEPVYLGEGGQLVGSDLLPAGKKIDALLKALDKKGNNSLDESDLYDYAVALGIPEEKITEAETKDDFRGILTKLIRSAIDANRPRPRHLCCAPRGEQEGQRCDLDGVQSADLESKSLDELRSIAISEGLDISVVDEKKTKEEKKNALVDLIWNNKYRWVVNYSMEVCGGGADKKVNREGSGLPIRKKSKYKKTRKRKKPKRKKTKRKKNTKKR